MKYNKKTFLFLSLLMLSFFQIISQVGYVKKFNGSPDWIEVAGKGNFGSSADGGTMRLTRTSGNSTHSTYFLRRNGSPIVLVAFRQDSAANAKSIGICIQNDSIKVLRRVSKAGASTVINKIAAPLGNFWIRITRNNLDLTIGTSTSGISGTPSYTNVATISGAFSGWANNYWKALGVASGGSNLATVEFAGYDGGAIIANLDSLKLSNVMTTTSTISFSLSNCSTSSISYSIKQGTTTVLTGTKNITANSASITHSLGAGNYTLTVSSSNCSSSVATSITVPTTGGTIACNCGFSILSVNQLTNTSGQFLFNSCSVSSLTWRLKATSTSTTYLATGSVNVTQSTIGFTIPDGTQAGTYYLEAFANNCTGVDTKSFSYVPTSSSTTAWVEHPDGQKVYNADGSVNRTVLTVILSGANSNIVSAISTTTCDAGYTLMSSLDGGNVLFNGNVSGWVAGVPTNVTMIPDGRMHSLTVACVGDIWGSGSNQGIQKVAIEYFKVGGSVSSTITPEAGLTYLTYHSNFQPSGTKRIPQFFWQFPDFTLAGKYNTTSLGIPKSVETIDMRKRGFAYWELFGQAKSLYSSEVNYHLDPDTWAGGALNNVSIMNNASTAQAQAWGTQFANTQGGIVRGSIVRDGEYRGMGAYTTQGLTNELYFFQAARSTAPYASLSEHQCAPYKVKSSWFSGEQTLTDLNKPATDTYVRDQLIVDYSANNWQSVFWANIPGQQAGYNAGAYMDINVSAYTSNYNSINSIYRIAWELWVNRKYFPDKKITTVIEGFDEVSVYGNRFGSVIESWSWSGGAATNWVQPKLSAAMIENVAAVSNFIGKGMTIWESTGQLQETDPSAYYSNNSLIGVPDGQTKPSVIAQIGTYPNYNKVALDYAVAYFEKHSRIPSDINQTLPFQFEISTDGGTTWITGENLNPLQLEKNRKPMAWGLSNTAGSKFAILAMFPLNQPEAQYSFKIRGGGIVGTKTITVNGQYPELIIAQ